MAIADAPVLDATPDLPDDDLPDTVVTPPEALAPVPEPTLAEVLAGVHTICRVVDGAFDKLPARLEAQSLLLRADLKAILGNIPPEGAAALQHLCDVLQTLVGTAEIPGKGLQVSGAPYAAQIIAKTPAGFTVSLAIQRTNDAAFLDSLTKLEQWMLGAGFTPAP